MGRFIAALCIICTAGTASSQETFTLPDDFASLEDALNPAVSGIDPGDIIVLRDDITYFGTFDVTVPDLTIRAAAGDSPVLDANGAGSVIKVNIGEGNITLEGLTIQDGSRIGNNDRGSGVEIVNAGLVTIRGCLIRDNNSSNFGGAGVGGANYDLLLEDSVIRDNTANGGGAIVMRNSGDLTIRNTDFIENTATADFGGAIFNDAAQSTVIIEDSSFEGNSTSFSAGAVFLSFPARAVISNTNFTENTAIVNPSGDAGAILFNRVVDAAVIDCDFVNNLANGNGAAVRLTSANNNAIEFIDSRFVGNESSAGTVFVAGGRIDLTGCEFVGNTALRSGDDAQDGGAIYFTDLNSSALANGRVYNCLFESNSADQGGAILIGRATVDVANSTFVNNTALGEGDAIAQGNGTSTIFNNVFAGHGADAIRFFQGTNATRFNLFDNEQAAAGTFEKNLTSTDPLFVDPSNGDYSLQAGSPAIDAGSSTLYEFGVFADFAGNTRVQDDPATTDTGVARTGPIIDIGAFEFNNADDCPTDFTDDGELDFFDVIEFLDQFEVGC